jgi:hypothetical protein
MTTGKRHYFDMRRGVNQGCVLGMILFCLAVQASFTEAIASTNEAKRRALDRAKGGAYADDFFSVSNVNDAKKIYFSLKARLAANETGVELAPGKSTMLWLPPTSSTHDPSSPSHDPVAPQHLVDFCTENKITLVYGVTKFLGSHIGTYRDPNNLLHSSKLALDKANKHAAKLGSMVSTDQLDFRLKRILLSDASRGLSYLNGTLPPPAMILANQFYDDVTIEAYRQLHQNENHHLLSANPPLTSMATQHLFQPTRLGGGGFSSCESTGPCLYISAIARASRTIANGLTPKYFKTRYVDVGPVPPTSPEPLSTRAEVGKRLPHLLLMASRASLIIDQLISRGEPVWPPDSLLHGPGCEDGQAHTVFSEYKSRNASKALNKLLMSRIHNANRLNILDDSSEADAARHRSRCGKGAGLFLSTLGDAVGFPKYLSRTAESMWAGHPLAMRNPTRDLHGNRLDPDANLIDLFMASKKLNKLNIGRHDDILRLLADFCIAAGASVIKEERVCYNNQKRFDITADFHDGTVYFDVSVIHVAAESHRKAAREEGGPALKREKYKLKDPHYVKIAKQKNATFKPFVVESYGRLGDIAEQAMSMLANRILFTGRFNDRCNQSLSAIKYEMRRRLGQCLYMGNAKIIQAGLARISRQSNGQRHETLRSEFDQENVKPRASDSVCDALRGGSSTDSGSGGPAQQE